MSLNSTNLIGKGQESTTESLKKLYNVALGNLYQVKKITLVMSSGLPSVTGHSTLFTSFTFTIFLHTFACVGLL